ncbi:preprotein translocase subunit SecY [Candidatus Parcubacteria bacterium]|nr:preprotein translocase subunit SecY [Candidatus Parcubacteria bacterium]
MLNKLIQIWKIKELRKNILFVFAMLVVFRIAASIPIAGVNTEALKDFFSGNQILGLLNIFSGGGMSNFSLVMLGIGPYITASIIFQLLTMIVPQLEEMNKDEQGRQKINQYTRIATVPLAALQGYGMITLFQKTSKIPIFTDLNAWKYFTMITIITAGTMFLVWLGELISEKKIGNGISILIFAGIVSSIPMAVSQTISTFDPTQITSLITFAVIALITTFAIVFITEGQRNIPISYAKQVRGMKMYGGMNTYLPLKVNQAGMIPIIFAIAIITFPPIVAQFFLRFQSQFISGAARFIIDAFNSQIFYGVIYFILVVAFTYFYTSIIFHPQQIADNLKKQGAFIPGIRPGQMTESYLAKTVSRIVFTGAMFLGIVAILPLILQAATGTRTLAISGASLLIVVGVVIESIKQIESQMTMRDYEGF